MNQRNTRFEYSPYEDDHREFEIRDDESARGPLILALALGVLIVFAAVVWNTYRQGVRGEDGELPMVTAETDAYKRVPDEPGGMEFDDLDRRLYDALDGSTRPPASQPASVDAQTALLAGPPRDLRPSAASPSNSSAPRDTVESEDLAPVERQPAPEPAQEEPSGFTDEADIDVDPAPVAEQPKPELRGEPDGKFAFASSGSFLVQISAVRSEDAANEAWSRLAQRHPEIFAGARKSVERADLGARGVFYRLRAGSFETREAASRFCDAYKQAGGDCIIVREE